MNKKIKHFIWIKSSNSLIVDFSDSWLKFLGCKKSKAFEILQKEVTKKKEPFNKNSFSFKGLKFKPLESDEKDVFLWAAKNEDYIFHLEDKLVEQRNFFDCIFLNIITDIVIFDSNHHYLYVNSKAIKDTKTREWIIGKTDMDYCKHKNISLQLAKKRRKSFLNVIKSKQSSEFIDKHIDSSGNEVYVHRKMHPIIIENQIQYVLGIGYDITDIKALEKRLEQSKMEYKSLFEENVAGIFLTKLDGSFVRWNKAFENIFGYKSHEFKRLNAEDLYESKQYRKKYIKELKINKGTLLNYLLPTLHKTGSKILLNANISFIDFKGEKYLQGTVFDITEKRKLKTKLLESIKS